MFSAGRVHHESAFGRTLGTSAQVYHSVGVFELCLQKCICAPLGNESSSASDHVSCSTYRGGFLFESQQIDVGDSRRAGHRSDGKQISPQVSVRSEASTRLGVHTAARGYRSCSVRAHRNRSGDLRPTASTRRCAGRASRTRYQAAEFSVPVSRPTLYAEL